MSSTFLLLSQTDNGPAPRVNEPFTTELEMPSNRMDLAEKPRSPDGDIMLVHSSDLHVDDDRIAAMHGGDGTGGLRGVLEAGRAISARIS